MQEKQEWRVKPVEFEIFEISRAETGEFVLAEAKTPFYFGPNPPEHLKEVEGRINFMLDRLKELAEKVFVLSWKGSSRVPQGVLVEGRKIHWTQHGRVLDENGDTIGYYDQVRDCEGESGDERQMVIYYMRPQSSKVEV